MRSLLARPFLQRCVIGIYRLTCSLPVPLSRAPSAPSALPRLFFVTMLSTRTEFARVSAPPALRSRPRLLSSEFPPAPAFPRPEHCKRVAEVAGVSSPVEGILGSIAPGCLGLEKIYRLNPMKHCRQIHRQVSPRLWFNLPAKIFAGLQFVRGGGYTRGLGIVCGSFTVSVWIDPGVIAAAARCARLSAKPLLVAQGPRYPQGRTNHGLRRRREACPLVRTGHWSRQSKPPRADCGYRATDRALERRSSRSVRSRNSDAFAASFCSISLAL